MKIGCRVHPLFKKNPLFYQPVLFYVKNLNPPFWEIFENLTPPLFVKGESKYVSSITCTNSFMTDVPIIKETSPLISRANKRTIFYMVATSIMKELRYLDFDHLCFSPPPSAFSLLCLMLADLCVILSGDFSKLRLLFPHEGYNSVFLLPIFSYGLSFLWLSFRKDSNNITLKNSAFITFSKD